MKPWMLWLLFSVNVAASLCLSFMIGNVLNEPAMKAKLEEPAKEQAFEARGDRCIEALSKCRDYAQEATKGELQKWKQKTY